MENSNPLEPLKNSDLLEDLTPEEAEEVMGGGLLSYSSSTIYKPFPYGIPYPDLIAQNPIKQISQFSAY